MSEIINGMNENSDNFDNIEKSVETTAAICYNEDAVSEADSLKGELPMNRISGCVAEQQTKFAARPEAKICALYERLSREDDDIDGQSNSIVNQKELLEEYASKEGFTKIRHYVDDGTSGVRFEREAWQELMADVENGKVAIILTKDMSRLGRNHVEVGKYMDFFREMDVRFIAVCDRIDSIYPETLEFAPFVNLINEMYARDISRKIKSSKRSKGRNGKYVSSIAPYGYKKAKPKKAYGKLTQKPPK